MKLGNEIKISVIISSYNRERYIIKAVQSLIDQNLSSSLFEIIVVDNNSSDGTVEKLNSYIMNLTTNHILILNEPKQGSSFARNHGADFAKGDLLVFMDDDAIANAGFLENALKFYIKHPEVMGFGGKIIPKYNPSEPDWMSPLVASLVGRFDYGNNIKRFEKRKYPLESNMAVSKAAFHAISGFNTSIPGVKGNMRIGGEGKDLFFRLVERFGPIFYLPDMVVDHIIDVEKLTPEYMYRVASGIGRGERVRIGSTTMALVSKFVEYIYKLGGSVAIGFYYFITARPQKAWPLVKFRIDVIKGFIE